MGPLNPSLSPVFSPLFKKETIAFPGYTALISGESYFPEILKSHRPPLLTDKAWSELKKIRLVEACNSWVKLAITVATIFTAVAIISSAITVGKGMLAFAGTVLVGYVALKVTKFAYTALRAYFQSQLDKEIQSSISDLKIVLSSSSDEEKSNFKSHFAVLATVFLNVHSKQDTHRWTSEFAPALVAELFGTPLQDFRKKIFEDPMILALREGSEQVTQYYNAELARLAELKRGGLDEKYYNTLLEKLNKGYPQTTFEEKVTALSEAFDALEKEPTEENFGKVRALYFNVLTQRELLLQYNQNQAQELYKDVASAVDITILTVVDGRIVDSREPKKNLSYRSQSRTWVMNFNSP